MREESILEILNNLRIPGLMGADRKLMMDEWAALSSEAFDAKARADADAKIAAEAKAVTDAEKQAEELKASRESYVVGVDIGQAQDPTAIAIVRKSLISESEQKKVYIYEVGHLERIKLNTSYKAVVSHVGGVMGRLPRSAELVLDYTGVGRPVYEMFHDSKLKPIGVTITAGGDVSQNETQPKRPIWNVPKLTLISQVQALLHSGTLKIQKDLSDAPALLDEMQEFRATVSDSGYWKFGARAGKHDDLVLALAIALWRAVGAKPRMIISDKVLALSGVPMGQRAKCFFR
jgi:hypothetical protein